MAKITNANKRNEIQEIHDEIEKIDVLILQANRKILGMDKHFKHTRDKELIEKIHKNLEWCANKTLLLMGRITAYELGSKLYYDREYLNFVQYKKKNIDWNTFKYIPLDKNNCSGKMFEKFVKNKSLGAKAQIGKVRGTNKYITTAILIPVEHKKLINYK
ncbi:MAG: hypothetical protein ABIB46_06305 [bacterium]